jgi:type I restriction-modification system DNA methylase subunit
MALARLEKPREKPLAKLTERDERSAESRRRAEDDRQDVATVGEELVALYADPDELLKHARVVGLDEVEENEFNLNIPRYVDTFEHRPRRCATPRYQAPIRVTPQPGKKAARTESIVAPALPWSGD